jgi:RNA polymerase sigma factor (sigma-70 family)
MTLLHDGLGDALTNSEVVENYWLWAHKVANSKRQPYHRDHDDLVQEALVEIWQVLERKGGKTAVSASYLAQAGSHRMNDVLDGRPMRGNPSEGGQTYRPKTVSADAIQDAVPDLWEQLFSVDALDDVEIAYHHGQIMAAIAELKPEYRRYVVLRFWGGMRDVDIAVDMHTSNKVVGTWWSRTIRPALQQQLICLELT